MSDPLTPWTIAYHPSLSLRFPRKEHWSGLPFPPPGLNPRLLHWQVDSYHSVTREAHIEAYLYILYKHMIIYYIKMKVAQSCDPMEYTARGILQARILEWVAFPFFRGSSQPRDRTQVSHIEG